VVASTFADDGPVDAQRESRAGRAERGGFIAPPIIAAGRPGSVNRAFQDDIWIAGAER
jgi:hypothetical protein